MVLLRDGKIVKPDESPILWQPYFRLLGKLNDFHGSRVPRRAKNSVHIFLFHLLESRNGFAWITGSRFVNEFRIEGKPRLAERLLVTLFALDLALEPFHVLDH